MTGTKGVVAALAGALALIGCGLSSSSGKTPSSSKITPTDQFLADKQSDLAAVVKVKDVETRWVILEDGDHVPLLVANCEMEELLTGKTGWGVGKVASVVQFDYSDMISDRIAPPAIEGRRFLLLASATPKDSEVPELAPWTAQPQGFLLIRRRAGGEFVHWSGVSYGVSAIRDVLKKPPLALDQIVDPARRLQVGQARFDRNVLGDEAAFIRGLLVNVQDPEGQAKKVELSPASNVSPDTFGMSAGRLQPHALWYLSLALLRDLGKDPARRAAVVSALTPIAKTSRPPIRLATALALAELGSDAGREALIRGFETDSGEISSDPPDRMSFPGRYRYDGSSITATAYALALLGDKRGLAHADPKVQLAAAEALKDRADLELRKTLEGIARKFNPKVEQLRASGELTKPREPGDFTNRYPEEWVRGRRELARLGDDDSLRRLVEAYLIDLSSYPERKPPLVPRGQLSTWSDSPSPAQAILGADRDRQRLLSRLQTLFHADARWDSVPFITLRESVERPAGGDAKAEPQRPTEEEIRKLLEDPSPDRRAEGLAAAGFHHVDSLFDKLVETAVGGSGIERKAAIYGLGFSNRTVPDAALRQMMGSGDQEARLSALELATRKNASRFANEAMDIVRARLIDRGPSEGPAGQMDAYLPRILCRLARGPIPAPFIGGLKDPDARVRKIVIVSLDLSGNPDAVKSLEPLERDSDAAVREAARTAIRSLGPLDE